jgi:hypothetical protein
VSRRCSFDPLPAKTYVKIARRGGDVERDEKSAHQKHEKSFHETKHKAFNGAAKQRDKFVLQVIPFFPFADE